MTICYTAARITELRNIEGYTGLIERVYLIRSNSAHQLTPEEISQNTDFQSSLDKIKQDPGDLTTLMREVDIRFRLLSDRQRYVLQAKYRLNEPGQPFRGVGKIAKEFQPRPVNKSYVYKLWEQGVFKIRESAYKRPICGLTVPSSSLAQRVRELNELELRIAERAPEVAAILPENLRAAALKDIEDSKTADGQINPFDMNFPLIKLVESYLFYEDAANARLD